MGGTARRGRRGRRRRGGRCALLVLAFAVLLPLGTAHAQRPRPNDPATDPYTGGEEERLRAAGLVSLGGFEFANTDTAGIDALLAAGDIRWIETKHFEIGMGLGPYRVTAKEKKKLLAELEELAAVLPEVNPETKLLDPWLRAHLFARRAEHAYARFLEIMQAGDIRFPDDDHPWMIGTPYRGEGPHLGQKGKFEVLLVPSKTLHVEFLRDQFGLRIETSQRWHVVERDTLLVSIHTQQGSLRNDTALHGHLVFNLAHLMLNGFEHYSYDTPFWLLEGLGHFMEREVDPRYNSFDGAEGAVPIETRKSDWDAEAKKLVGRKKAPRVAELVRLKNYGDFELAHHIACWSMTKFMIERYPDGYAGLNEALHGLKNAEGYPDSADIPGKHRAAFRKCLGLSYPEFDSAWAEWAKAQ